MTHLILRQTYRRAHGSRDDFDCQYTIFPSRTGIFDRVVNFEAAAGVTPDRVRIVHTNDVFTDNLDRNLRINSVRIGNQTIDPSRADVFSTATWRPEDGGVAGFGRGNVLHGNGYFQLA